MLGSSFFGRVQPSPDEWEGVKACVPPAPMLAPFAEPPAESPQLWRYRNPRYRGQLIGCCVGESGASMVETSCRTPADVATAPAPGPEPIEGSPSISALGVYWMSRDYSRRQGRPLRGEGAIVTDALAALTADGCPLYEDWPSTPENYRAYRDEAPPASFRDGTRLKVAGEARRLESAQQVLQYLAAGYSVQYGGPWRSGTATDRRGYFSWGSAPTGGHAVELLGYSKTLNRLYVGNSWDNAGWGVQPDDPSQPRGWGWCVLNTFLRDLSDANLSRGIVEAVVICEVAWRPTPPLPPGPTPPLPPLPPLPPEPAPAGTATATIVVGDRVYAGTLPRIR